MTFRTLFNILPKVCGRLSLWHWWYAFSVTASSDCVGRRNISTAWVFSCCKRRDITCWKVAMCFIQISIGIITEFKCPVGLGKGCENRTTLWQPRFFFAICLYASDQQRIVANDFPCLGEKSYDKNFSRKCLSHDTSFSKNFRPRFVLKLKIDWYISVKHLSIK